MPAQIGRDQVQRLVAEGAQLVEVLPAPTFQKEHLPGAVNIPRGVLEFQVGSHPSLEDPQRPVVVYCRSGGRAALAALTLGELGFGNVRSIAGGIMGWAEADLPVHVPEPAH